MQTHTQIYTHTHIHTHTPYIHQTLGQHGLWLEHSELATLTRLFNASTSPHQNSTTTMNSDPEFTRSINLQASSQKHHVSTLLEGQMTALNTGQSIRVSVLRDAMKRTPLKEETQNPHVCFLRECMQRQMQQDAAAVRRHADDASQDGLRVPITTFRDFLTALGWKVICVCVYVCIVCICCIVCMYWMYVCMYQLRRFEIL